MSQRLRLAVLGLALAVAVSASAPASASAAVPGANVDIKVSKAVIDWVKKNLPALYIIVDEIIDDLTGCGCPPPPPVPQEPPDPRF